MNNSFPNFPMKEFEAEREQELAEFKSAIQESLDKSLAELYDQNPQLMDAEITKLPRIKISLKLAEVPLKGILLKYLEQLQDSVYQQLSSQQKGKLVNQAHLVKWIFLSLYLHQRLPFEIKSRIMLSFSGECRTSFLQR